MHRQHSTFDSTEQIDPIISSLKDRSITLRFLYKKQWPGLATVSTPGW